MKTIFLNTLNVDKNNALLSSVLTIGNFDGVHLGHQAMLAQLRQTAKAQNLASMVMIFEPQPREYFAQLKGKPESAPARLTSLHEKLALFKQFDIDIVVVASFDEDFRSLSAREFADLLVKKLNVKSLVLGDDFRFGHDRTGDSAFLRDYGLPVTNLHTVTDNQFTNSQFTNSQATEDRVTDNQITDSQAKTTADSEIADDRISSTRIRELLREGDLTEANRLLGHDYAITGEVLHGDKIGRTLDFPTANIELNRIQPPLRGIYGVDVVVLDASGDIVENAFPQIANSDQIGLAGLRAHSLFGTANIGVRPSVDKPHDWRLEVFFPEFSGDLYGKTLHVRFLHFLHDERKYESLEALKAGIMQDVADLIYWRDAQ